MEDLIDRLDIINVKVNVLSDDDKIKFNTEIITKLDVMNKIIDELNDAIKKYGESIDKVKYLELVNKKHNIITKQLFTEYWILFENMNNTDIAQLNILEKSTV